MPKKKIGVLFGMEDTFPWALMNEINRLATAGGEEIEAAPVRIWSRCARSAPSEYAVILDRISHEVPFYRTWLKCAIARGRPGRQQPDLVVAPTTSSSTTSSR